MAEKRLPIVLKLWYANDLGCEWAYVVDLDNSVFEVYAGAVPKINATSKRFNDIGDKDSTVPALVRSYPFTKLPAVEEFTTVFSSEDLRDYSGEDGVKEHKEEKSKQ